MRLEILIHEREKIKTREKFLFFGILKYCVMLLVSLLWAIFSYILAKRWIDDLSFLIGNFAAHFIIFGIAIIPGWMNAFYWPGFY